MNLLRFRKSEAVDGNVFKVNLGAGEETLTYYELQHRFDNLTEDETEYLHKNVRHCTNLTSIPDDWGASQVTDLTSVFANCKTDADTHR